MGMVGKVRRMRLRDQFSINETTKRTGLARNTVKKWLSAAGNKLPRYRKISGKGKLTAFEASLELPLKADAGRPKQSRRSGKALFVQIQAQG